MVLYSTLLGKHDLKQVSYFWDTSEIHDEIQRMSSTSGTHYKVVPVLFLYQLSTTKKFGTLSPSLLRRFQVVSVSEKNKAHTSKTVIKSLKSNENERNITDMSVIWGYICHILVSFYALKFVM